MHFAKIFFFGALVAAKIVSRSIVESPPFNLIILSDNTTINGSTLFACHEGAGIEALCPDFSTKLSFGNASAAEVFNFNYSSTDTSTAPGGVTGLITWFLPLGGRNSSYGVSSALELSYSPTTNVAVPLFYPGNGFSSISVAFDECDKLNIQGYVDDTTSTPTGGVDTAYYRWYICTTIPTWYTYTTLAWVLGSAAPENPTCQKVEVQRLLV